MAIDITIAIEATPASEHYSSASQCAASRGCREPLPSGLGPNTLSMYRGIILVRLTKY